VEAVFDNSDRLGSDFFAKDDHTAERRPIPNNR